MKKFLTVLTLSLCLGLAACGGSAESDLPGAFVNTETKDVVALGMTREEIGNVISPKVDAAWVEEDWGEGSMFYGETPEESLVVLYTDNKAVGILVDDRVNSADTSQWKLKGDVTKGCSLDAITAAYGENADANTEGKLFSYTLEDGSTVSFLVQEEGGLRAYAAMAGAGSSAETAE